MPLAVVAKDDQYVLNQCTKYLARDNTDTRHNFGGEYDAVGPRGLIAEAWRFPVVDTYWDGDPDTSYGFDAVTFIWDSVRFPAINVGLVTDFAELYHVEPLRPIEFANAPSGLLALTVQLPKGRIGRYKFLVDGQWRTDPINPRTGRADNGALWSCMVTSACAIPLMLNRRSRELLTRLVSHLLPFRSEENSEFIRQSYESLDRRSREATYPLAYRVDLDIGVANYIDKLLFLEETHHALDYRICLPLIDNLLRARILGRDPLEAPIELYADLYEQMASGDVPDWDLNAYSNPGYFLLLLRRHAMTGAFVHPRHGGNAGAIGWKYLESRFVDPAGATYFDWERSIEAPLGRNLDYRG